MDYATGEPAHDRATRHVGADRLHVVDGDRVEIDAAHPHDDWIVSRHRPVAVELPEGRFAVRRAEPGRGARWRYELTRWTRHDGDRPALEVRYDAGYVAARDRRHRVAMAGDITTLLLTPALPLLGLLPSPAKRALERRIGFEPRSATLGSLGLQRIFLIALGTLLAIDAITGTPLTAFLDGWGWVFGVVLCDWLLRTSAMQDDRRAPPGLFEWLWPGSWRAS